MTPTPNQPADKRAPKPKHHVYQICPRNTVIVRGPIQGVRLG